MPRKTRENDYLPSTEYGMDEYDDPLENMTPDEIREFADYVEMIQRCGGDYTVNFEDSSDDSESENDLYQNNFEEGR